MRCDACHGEGKLKPREIEASRAGPALPCPECNGSGVAHCCDGMCEQAEDGDASGLCNPAAAVQL